jgi:hypothetical protein
MTVHSWLHRYVPGHFRDPWGLAARLIRSGDPAAMFAMASAAAGIVAAPIDAVLGSWERRRDAVETAAGHPLILVCGPPRSGTTLVAQTLINHLPVAYFTNLTSIFPRAPLTASRLFERMRRSTPRRYKSYYGKTAGLFGPNDALYLWDRWLGADRDRPPLLLTDEQSAEMRRFFAACDRQFNRPIVAKNNNLIASAGLVAKALPQARFICLTRDPRSLALSLYKARLDIHGTAEAAYGPELGGGRLIADPIESVCRQTVALLELAERQQQAIGTERFWRVGYEDFCKQPADLVRRTARDILGEESLATGEIPASFPVSGGAKLPADVVARIEGKLAELSLS